MIDSRGTFVSLSHFCPTAAALLLESDVPLEIVEDPPAFPARRGYEGLDATGEWPPLLRANVLLDPRSYSLWERYLVEHISRSPLSVGETLARLAARAERLRSWSADRGQLSDWIRTVLDAADERDGVDSAAVRYDEFSAPPAYARVLETIPLGVTGPSLPADIDALDRRLVAPHWPRFARLALRYLSARAFGSWTAYQSRGIRTQVAELYLTHAVLRVECGRVCLARRSSLDRQAFLEAVRASDLLLVHLADREAVMAWLGKVDSDAPSQRSR